jgi:transposase InsO family protein
MKYQFIMEISNDFPISRICHVLNVSKSGYYSWLKAPKSNRELENDELVKKIKSFHEISEGVYGSPRIYNDLIESGVFCGIHRVERLMKVNNIYAKTKKKFKVTTDSEHSYPVAPNILNRDFIVEKKDTVWVSDITYIPTREGWLYLCIIMDLFSRMIVGWSMANHMRSELVEDAVKMAWLKRNPADGLIFHSDRGVQYACNSFKDLINSKKCIQSMSRKGDCWDNACAESFFHSLKTEKVYFNKYKTREEAKSSIFKYIEIFYNRQRRHSYLGYRSPENYEQFFLGKAA